MIKRFKEPMVLFIEVNDTVVYNNDYYVVTFIICDSNGCTIGLGLTKTPDEHEVPMYKLDGLIKEYDDPRPSKPSNATT